MVSRAGVCIHNCIQDGCIRCVTYDTANCGVSLTVSVRSKVAGPYSDLICAAVFDHGASVGVGCVGTMSVSYDTASVTVSVCYISADIAVLDVCVDCFTGDQSDIASAFPADRNGISVCLDMQTGYGRACTQLCEEAVVLLHGHLGDHVRADTDSRICSCAEILDNDFVIAG